MKRETLDTVMILGIPLVGCLVLGVSAVHDKNPFLFLLVGLGLTCWAAGAIAMLAMWVEERQSKRSQPTDEESAS